MKKVLCILLCLAVFMVGIGAYAVSTKTEFIRDDLPGIYTDTAVENWISPSLRSEHSSVSMEQAVINGQPPQYENDALRLDKGDVLRLPLSVTADGTYYLIAEYRSVAGQLADNELAVRVDSEAYMTSLPLIWADQNTQYPKDKYGNELSAEQRCLERFVCDKLVDRSDIRKEALKLSLKSGSYQLEIENQAQSIDIRALHLSKVEELPSYSQYQQQYGQQQGGTDITVQGELYALKSDSFIRAGGAKNQTVSPYDSFVTVMNNLNGASWSDVGQKVAWEFAVEQEGWYGLSFRYSQTENTNKPVFRKIEIDGQVPYSELENIAFPQTRIGAYENLTVMVGDAPAKVYLTKGNHTIAMTVSLGGFDQAYDRILAIMQELNDLGMQLKKLTAGSTDKNRTWDMSVYLPDTVPTLDRIANEIDALYGYLEQVGGVEPVYAQNLIYASESLRKLIDESRTIPNHIDLISTGDNSATKYLGEVLNMLLSQALSLDSFTLYAQTPPQPIKASVLSSVWEGYKAFAYSFTDEAAEANYAAGEGSEDVLQVWVNRPVQYIDVLQQLVDSKYTAQTGQKVQISIMPTESKLILATAAGSNPDVVLGAAYFTPFEFAIRGAAKNLLGYEDFLSFYNEQYNLEALVPLSFENGVYGAVETQDFQVLYYRQDILDTLGLEVPETWEDVKEIMPTLLRYSMNVYLPLSSSNAFKNLHATGPFIYQNNGSLYTPDGLSVAYDTEATTAGIKEMIELYRIYGVQQTVADFYNSFRYGDVPLGISGFTTYLQMQVAAPELEGRWNIALAPGVEQEDGSILRYQMANSTACMIFENTNFEQESWEFLKWWLSAETQLEYAYMMESTYGVTYRWNTANTQAFAQLPYPEAHKQIVLEQWENQKENLRHPAMYMVERELSNIWLNVVINSDTLVTEIDRATIEANREILRKLQEFGYYDSEKNVIKNYPMMTYEQLAALLEE